MWAVQQRKSIFKCLRQLYRTMQIKKKLKWLYDECNNKFEEQFEFKMKDVSFEKMVIYMNKPKDPSSLAVARILFGLAMLFDIPDERGGATMEKRWGDPKLCHFPLLPFVLPLPMPYMALVYAALWLGALGIMLGYKYKMASAMFVVCYWYLFLIEKSYWNNHSYLFGLVGLLLACTDAHCYWSLETYLDPSKRKETVPYWNYFILKYQFFILYFMAGLKKGTAEWLSGFSVQNLSEHWVFAPFRLFLTVQQTDYLVVHWFIFAFDLTVAAWLMWARSRHIAVLFCALFHLMNSRLFRIGMFPWVCLATMPLFYPFDWPKLAIKYANKHYRSYRNKLFEILTKTQYSKEFRFSDEVYQNLNKSDATEDENEGAINDTNGSNKVDEEKTLSKDSDGDDYKDASTNNATTDDDNISATDKNADRLDETTVIQDRPAKDYITMYLIIFFVVTQALLPYSHFITKGYNNWTNGLYGYSWDMMVHTWEPHSVVVKVVDNDDQREYYVDPYLLTPNDRWTRHGDMVFQYARCLEQKIAKSRKREQDRVPKNISIYIDVWCSMNGRFVQRMFDPKVDLLKVDWSPLQPVAFLMPVLDHALHWRSTLDEIRENVNSWSDYSDVTFFADFSGYEQEKFIPTELRNVTLTVLEGLVAFVPEVTDVFKGHSFKMAGGNHTAVRSGNFHKVLNIGNTTALYMYTYYNSSETNEQTNAKPKLPIGSEMLRRLQNMFKFAAIIVTGVTDSLFKFSECP